MKLELDKNELMIINNSINEALELLPAVDYTTRIGAPQEEIENLLSRIKKEFDRSI